MNEMDHQRIISEIHFNRALLWMLGGYIAGTEHIPFMVLCLICMAHNVWKSYVEWPDEQ